MNLYVIDVGYFCAAVVVQGETVIDAAPILAWAVGKPADTVFSWAQRKRGRVTGPL